MKTFNRNSLLERRFSPFRVLFDTMKKQLIAIIIFMTVFHYGCFHDSIKSEKNLLEMSIVEASNGKFAKAKDLIEKFLTNNPENIDALEMSQVINDSISKNINRKSAVYFFKGLNCFNNGLLEESILNYSSSITHAPHWIKPYLGRAIDYRNLKDYNNAIKDYSKVIQLDPSNSSAFYNRGLTYKKNREKELALLDFDMVIELSPNWVDAYLNRGRLYYDMYENDKAIMDFDKAIELAPYLRDAHYYKGHILNEKSEYESAINCYNNVLKIDPDFAYAFYYRGVVYNNMNKFDDAISDYKKAIEMNPNISEANSNLGNIYFFFKNDKEKACSCWKRACDLGECFNFEQAVKSGQCPEEE